MSQQQIIQQPLEYSRSTKRTHVFASTDPDAAVSTLYVAKDAFAAFPADGVPPRTITITVAANGGATD